MKKLIVAFAAVMILLTSGCGRVLDGPRMDDVYSDLSLPALDTARLYFLRPGKKAYGSGAKIDIDGIRVINLSLSGCYYHEVHPGSRELELTIPADFGSHEMTLDVEPQSSRYFKIEQRNSRKWSIILFSFFGAVANYAMSDADNDGTVEFVEVSREDAERTFSECAFFNEQVED